MLTQLTCKLLKLKMEIEFPQNVMQKEYFGSMRKKG